MLYDVKMTRFSCFSQENLARPGSNWGSSSIFEACLMTEKSRFVLLDPFFHNACLIHLNSFSLSLDVIHQHLFLLLLLLSFSCFPGVVLLFYDGSLLPLSLSQTWQRLWKVAALVCHSEEFLVTDCHSRGFLFFLLYSASPPIRPCKATTKTPHSSTNPFDIHSCISIIHPNV